MIFKDFVSFMSAVRIGKCSKIEITFYQHLCFFVEFYYFLDFQFYLLKGLSTRSFCKVHGKSEFLFGLFIIRSKISEISFTKVMNSKKKDVC